MEEWVDIKNYEGLYQISSFGRVKSLQYRKSNRRQILKAGVIQKYYLRIELSKKGKSKRYLVHRLVGQAFLGLDINDSKMCVLHKKETLTNGLLYNGKDNLFLGTHKDNMKDRNKKNRCNLQGKIGKLNYNSKEINQFTKDGLFIKTWDCAKDIVNNLGINGSCISNCCNGKRKTAGNYIWKFKESAKKFCIIQ